MGNDQDRLAGAEGLHRIHHIPFGGNVERAGRLVEHEDRRLMVERPGNPDPLALTARDPDPAFADLGLQPLLE